MAPSNRYTASKRRPSGSATRGIRGRTLLFGTIATLLVGAVMGHMSSWNHNPRIDHTDKQQVARGRELYAVACASCHGGSLEGQKNWQRRGPDGRMPAPPHDASGHTWHHPDAALVAIIKYGPKAYPANYPTDMPAFADRLSDRDIAAILAYIKSTWPPSVREKQLRINSDSRK